MEEFGFLTSFPFFVVVLSESTFGVVGYLILDRVNRRGLGVVIGVLGGPRTRHCVDDTG